MGNYQSDPFLEAVVEAHGRPIPDAAWKDCEDRFWREQFESKKKGESDAAVRAATRCVRDVITKALTIAAEINEGSSAPAGDGADRRRDVPATTQEQSGPFYVTLLDYEENRALAFALEVASLADTFYGNRIRRFREEELSGQLVNLDDVEALYHSPESRALVSRLSREAKVIAGGLRVWSADDAAYYILTDQPPRIHPLRGQFELVRPARRTQRGLIVIEVEPWVSEKTVVRLYHEVRGRVLPRHDARPQGMAVWQFVESLHSKPRPTLRDVWRELATGRPAKTIAFREVWQRWRAAHPDLRLIKIVDACRQWNSDNPGRKYPYCGKFQEALLSGIEHGGTITWPGYQMLTDRTPPAQ